MNSSGVAPERTSFSFTGDFGEDRIVDFKPGTERILFEKGELVPPSSSSSSTGRNQQPEWRIPYGKTSR
jgi:hypothetical protein